MDNLISIIVPIYNAEKYLVRCLDSLINQTYKNIEILCINDGSTDNSLNILNEYATKDKRIIVINQTNSGPATARNNGLDNANGTFLMFCDSDDYYEPNMCERMLDAILSHNVALVMCDCKYIKEEYFTTTRTQKDIKYHNLKLIGFHSINKNNYDIINVILWNKIFKTSLVEKYHISFPDGYEHDDASFILKYLAISSSYYGLNEKLYNYNISNPNSLMENLYRKNNQNHFDFLYAYNDATLFMLKTPNIRKEIIEKYKNKYINMIKYWGSFLDNSNKIQMFSILQKQLLNITFFDDITLIKAIKNGDTKLALKLLKIKPKYSLIKKIFSLKNDNNHKVICILGTKIKIRKKNTENDCG